MYCNVLDYFEETVSKFPDKTAVVHRDTVLTFKELSDSSKCIAGKILQYSGNIRNKPVGVLLSKSADVVAADIGVIYSGNVFMNLDIKTPVKRIENSLNSIKPAMIITDAGLYDKYRPAFGDTTVILIQEAKSAGASDVIIDEIRTQSIDTDPFCIINTSGSTGIPKGVVLNYRSFFDFMDWSCSTFSLLNEDTIIGSLSPAVFDIYVFELCLLMVKGASMVLLDADLGVFPVKLLDAVERNKVNFIFWVPSIMVNIANKELLSRIELTYLKLVWFAGEVFPTKQFNYWRKCLPGVRFVNLYGPIEITLDCTYYEVEREFPDNEPLPIGYPCRNTDILILNDKDEACKEGEEGELCVRGTSLAMGYYNNPEKTSAVFVQNPLNKSYPELIYRTGDVVLVNERREIIFKGRKDSLVKHMGYRIELGEIEHVVINTLHLFEYCCVLYDYIKKNIVLIYESGEKIETGIIRNRMLEVLPKYMVPVIFHQLELLPRNTNGKIDRQKLKEIYLEDV